MQTRNATYNSTGNIDLEIEHPIYGWIPFTADPNDSEKLGRDLFAELQNSADPYAEQPKPAKQLINEISTQRKAAEANGITHNGIRYAGDESNRQALNEAIDFAKDAGLTEFTAWKDSDNEFIVNHPLSEVEQAYRLVGQNRMRLIELEGQYIAQVKAGTLTDTDGLTW